MDRARFEHLLAAYGADFRRWPAEERGSATIFASRHAAEIEPLMQEARELDGALDASREELDVRTLAARVLAGAPRPAAGFDRRALIALAACAAFGMVLGYGGGLLAPTQVEDGAYFAMAFGAPAVFEDEG